MSETTAATEAPTKHAKLVSWVEEIAELTQPDSIQWCDGSAEEYDALAQQLVDAGTFEKLSDAKRPNSFLVRSDPGDVARVEDQTYICSESKDDAGPTNNWCDPAEMRDDARQALHAARWPAAPCTWCPSPWARSARPSPASACRSPTSAYAVANMHIMTRVGADVWKALGDDGEFVRGMHTVGYPLDDGQERRAVAVQRRPSTSSTSPRRARSGRTARATAATRCSARSATRCASPP